MSEPETGPAAEPEPEHATEGRRYPSTMGGMFYIGVLAATGVGIALITTGRWRLGTLWMAGSLIAAASARLVLPQRDAGMLAVRHRMVDVVMLAGKDSLTIDINRIEARLSAANYQPVVASLIEVGFNSSLQLFSTYATQASDLTAWVSDGEINRDRNLRLQYLAGTGLNAYQGDAIFSSMVSGRRFPTNLFVADEGWKGALRGILGTGQ